MSDPATPIVVLGGAGRVGARLMDRAASQFAGRLLVCVDLVTGPAAQNRVVSLVGDVTRPSDNLLASLGDLSAFELVVLSAMIRNEVDGTRCAEEMFEVNAVGPVNLAAACRERLRKVIFASSVEVYGRPIDGRPFREEQRLAPLTAYGISKLTGEQVMTALCRQLNIPLVTLRFTSIYGSQPPLGNALEAFWECAMHGETLRVFGDGSARRDFIHVDDAAGSIIAALDFPCSDVFNIAHPDNLSLRDLADLAVEVAGSGSVVHVPEPRPPVDRVMDVTRMLGTLGFRPQIDVGAGLRLLRAAQSMRTP